MAEATCPNCGPTSPEPHPRLPVQRCSNCKEHLQAAQQQAIKRPGGDMASAPLTAQRYAEIRQGQPTEWLPKPWTIHQIEGDGETPGYWQVLHEETVIATLPDWAGNLALWMASAPDDIRDLLAEVERMYTEPGKLDRPSSPPA